MPSWPASASVGLVLESADVAGEPGLGGAARLLADALDALNRKAIALMEEIRDEYATPAADRDQRLIGPRGRRLRPGARSPPTRRELYHATQIATFADDRRRHGHRVHDELRGGGDRHRARAAAAGCRS